MLLLPDECRVDVLRFLDRHTLHCSVRWASMQWNNDIVHAIGLREEFDLLEFDTDYMGSPLHYDQLPTIEDGYFCLSTKNNRHEKLTILPEMTAKCCSHLTKYLPLIANHQIFAELGDNMLLKMTLQRGGAATATSSGPNKTVTFYCPNIFESSDAALKLLHFFSHLDTVVAKIDTLQFKMGGFNHAVLCDLFKRIPLQFNIRRLHTVAKEIPLLLLGAHSMAHSVAEVVCFDEGGEQVKNVEEVLELVDSGGGPHGCCREKLELHVEYDDVVGEESMSVLLEEAGTSGTDVARNEEKKEENHPLEKIVKHLSTTPTDLQQMVPEVEIKRRYHHMKKFLPWRWPRANFPTESAFRVERQGFYGESRHTYHFHRVNAKSGDKFTVSLRVQQGSGPRGDELLDATITKGWKSYGSTS